MFRARVLCVLPIQGDRVSKDGGRFLKTDAMLGEVESRLGSVPGEHIYVYTLIRRGRQARVVSVRRQRVGRKWTAVSELRPGFFGVRRLDAALLL